MIPENVFPKAERLYNFARELNYSHEAAIGVCANVMAESGFLHDAVEVGGGGGYGLGQWTPKENLYSQGAILGYSAAECDTFDVQSDILLRGDETGQWTTGAYSYDPLVTIPQTLDQYKQETNINQATMNYMAHWERPHEDPEVNHKERRKQYAQIFQERITGEGLVYPFLPVNEGTPTTDEFGWRINPVTFEEEFHNGLDYAGKLNDPIYATMSGTVVASEGGNALRGNWIMIKHDLDPYYSKYLHLNGRSVAIGDIVSKGQIIGVMGSTGQSTGVHLHFTISTTPEGENDGGIWIDPRIYLNTPYGSDKGKMNDLIQLWLSGALNGWEGR